MKLQEALLQKLDEISPTFEGEIVLGVTSGTAITLRVRPAGLTYFFPVAGHDISVSE